MCKVSVVIPYYNSRDTILRALNSVKNQSFKDYEIIVVNDGSKDDSEEIVKLYISNNKELRIKSLNQTNRGPSVARNNGIKAANGEYIAFLDSDDSFEPNKLEIQIDFLEKNKDIFIVSTNYIIQKGEEPIIRYKQDKEYEEANFYKMLFKFFFYLSSTVIRRHIFEEGLGFKENKNYGEDHLLFLEVARKYRGARLAIPLTRIYKFEFGEGGLTENLNALKVNEFDNFRILYKNNIYSDKKINIVLYYFIIFMAYLKHLKRVWKTKLMHKRNREMM
ncbi:glycosyltransferase family 2 protein [Clostridium sp. CF012]|uniref:glycosyltransferase family 2 protein n=1 Tax=Clostridium sp. CF012 TaxID=2843319 RepID=UPI001C0BF938|nr:glycosyltransferase family 2 protein [Clostridium sp. CF012]MBU3142588.1 glycosyltransferase [Clostridium sp. CF012]